MRTNSNPMLLNTIKMPRDMLRLKAILPEKRYKNAHSDKFKSDLSELLDKDNLLKESVKNKEKSIKIAKSYLDLPQTDNNINQLNNNRRDRNNVDINKRQENKHDEISIYNSINGNQVQSNNHPNNQNNLPNVNHKPVNKLIYKDELPLIVDHNIKQVNDVPKNLNIYNHKQHNSRPKLTDITSNNNNPCPNIIDMNHNIERLVLDDDLGRIKQLDDTDKFIIDNMKKHNDK